MSIVTQETVISPDQGLHDCLLVSQSNLMPKMKHTASIDSIKPKVSDSKIFDTDRKFEG